jgi:hypothetical protein
VDLASYSILKSRSNKYNPVLVNGGDGVGKPRVQLKHLGLFLTKDKSSKNIRFGNDVGWGGGGGTGVSDKFDRLGLVMGLRGMGGNISIRKNDTGTRGSRFRLGSL